MVCFPQHWGFSQFSDKWKCPIPYLVTHISKNFKASSCHAMQKGVFNDNNYSLLNVYKVVLRTLYINALTAHIIKT